MQKFPLLTGKNTLRCITALLYFFFIWLFIKPDLLYYSIVPNGNSFPVFQTGIAYFLSSLHWPIGPVDYISDFLSQSYAIAWLGALVTTVLAAVSYVEILSIGYRMNGRQFDLFACIPATICLVMIGGYRNPVPLMVIIDIALSATLIVLLVVHSTARLHPHSVLQKHEQASKTGFILQSPALALFITAIAAIFVVCNHTDRDRARLTAYTCLGRWNDIITTTNHLPLKALDASTVFDLDVALFHTGKLGCEIFKYPQPIKNLIDGAMPGKSPSFPADIRFVRFHYDLGDISRAQKVLYEIFVNETEHPYVLNLMAEIHLIKGQIAASKRIYRRLCRDLVYGNSASAMLKCLSADTVCLLPENINEKRSLALERDTCVSQFSIKQICIDLLERNPHNRMAYEYLMTLCLFSGELRLFVDYLERFGASFTGFLPQHWAEAVEMYNEMSPPGERTLTDKIPQEVVSESIAFKDKYLSIKQSCMMQGLDESRFKEQAYNDLRQRFGNTVLFFYFFHESGAVRWPH